MIHLVQPASDTDGVKLPIIRVASLASQGPPHDAGLAIGKQVLQQYGHMCINGGASEFYGYTPTDLNTPEDSWSIKEYPAEHSMLPANPGYSSVGLGAWRAVILRKTIDLSQDGDIVVVHCSNFIKYPKFKFFAAKLRQYVEAIVKFTDVYAPMHFNNAMFAGSDTFDLIEDPAHRDLIAAAPMGQCRLIVMLVNPETRAFAQLFEKTVHENPQLLSPYNKSPYKTFPFDRQIAEQSVFNILAYREGIFPTKWKSTWIEKLQQAAHSADSGGEMILSLNLTR